MTERVQLGSSGPNVSRICFGCWSMGGSGHWGWDNVDDRESIAAVHQALDVGINFFDSAPLYGLGHAEEVLGKALKGKRNDVVIATKCGVYRTSPTSDMFRDSSPATIRRECEESLRRLGTDHIDLYLIHWADEKVPFDDSMEALFDLVAEGKVGHVGVCNFSVRQMEESQANASLTASQNSYNMLHREVEGEILPYCRKRGLGFMAYSPLASGILGGRFSEGTVLGDRDWRKMFNPDFQGETLKENLRKIRQLAAVAEKHSKTMAQLAIAWVLTHPEVDVAVVGMKRPEQVSDCHGALGWRVGDSDMRVIDGILSGR